jgi:hypothetical protein
VASALEQLMLTDIPPVINHIKSSRAIPGEEYWVRAFIEDEDPSPDVKLVYQVNSGEFQEAQMFDDGQHHDHEAGDGCYGCILVPFQTGQTLSWQISATDNTNPASLLPCLPAVFNFHDSTDPQLFINEFMADNDTTIADEYGEYDNWVEIYNGDDEAVWLGDKYLSDNLSNPDKWQLPDVTMQPGSFLIIWADGQSEQGPYHADYKLNDEGEELGIFDNETTGYFLLDSVSWGMQNVDISYGRKEDGDEPWIFFNSPTPGYSNEPQGINENIADAGRIRFYPNPVTGGTIHFSSPFSGQMHDFSGRMVWIGNESREIQVGELAPGLYFLIGWEGKKEKILILK